MPALTCPSLASPSRAPPQRLSQRQARMRRPRLGPAAPAATWGDGAAAAAPGGAGSGLGAARRRQVRAKRGALCGGGAGTAVRAAPACARSATPRLGTRAGSAGRGQPGSRLPLDSQRARRPLPGSPGARGPRAGASPASPLLQFPHCVPAWRTRSPSQASPPDPHSGREVFSQPEASVPEGKERGPEVTPGELVPGLSPGTPCAPPAPAPESQGLCLSFHSGPA